MFTCTKVQNNIKKGNVQEPFRSFLKKNKVRKKEINKERS